MPGLVPDNFDSQRVGSANNFAGERVASPDGTVVPFPKAPQQTTIKIDGDTITVIDGAAPDQGPQTSEQFDDNLALLLSEDALSTIAQELLEGIDSDIRSRQGFVENYEKGMDYLGLKMTTQSVARGRRSTAKVYHPALQWACVKFQSGARGELLPAGGPAKVAIGGPESLPLQEVARDFEQDFNYYLTTAAPEFYVDSDRGHYYLAYGGNLYKKIYRCPVRKRPVSESVYIPELIVSNDATSLETAERVTHEIEMMDRATRQLMALGVYRDIPLTTPVAADNRLKKKERDIAGRKQTPDRPQDTPRTIYETYCFLDLSRFGFDEKGQPYATSTGTMGAHETGIPIPYRVSLDKDARQILEIRRNWKPDDDSFRRRRVFVKYGMIPGMGFLDYGYVHLVGNVVQALTALLRLTIDSGMFSNFPGGIRLKGARADTNEINPGPGEFAELDVPVEDIRKAIMAMPYKEPSLVVFQMMQYLEDQVQKIAGAVEFESGEGRTNIPVGTIMAMIEQQSQIMTAIHKRLHTAQKNELIALKELFVEYPEDLDRLAGVSGRKWAETGELADLRVMPRSDPNIPAQSHRIMQSYALAMLVQQAPQAFNQHEVLKRLLLNINIGDVDGLLAPPQTQAPPPDPKVMLEQQKLQMQQTELQQSIAKDAADNQQRSQELAVETQNKSADRDNRLQIAALKLEGEKAKVAAAAQNRNPGLTPGESNGP